MTPARFTTAVALIAVSALAGWLLGDRAATALVRALPEWRWER